MPNDIENLPQVIEQEESPPSSRPVPWQALMPRNFTEALEFAKSLSVSNLIPNSFKNRPGDIMIAIQWGAEIGLRPLQSLNSVAVINGRPGIFGDAAIALVWASGLCLSYDEAIEGDPQSPDTWVGVAQSWRANTPSPISRRFSVTDAKQAKLWGKPGPWQEYPRRMLPIRARGFLLRDLYPDVLRGTITAEELRDFPLSQLNVKPYPVEELEARFNKSGAAPLVQTDSGGVITGFPQGQGNSRSGGNVTAPPPLKRT